MTKTKVIIIGGVLILSVFIGLFVRIFSREPQSKSEKISAPIQSSKEATPESLNVPVLPIPKPGLKAISKEKSLPSTVVPFFENINKAAKIIEKSLTPNNAPIQQNTSNTTSAGIILSLTKDQFHFLYPDYFIASLIDAQTFFIKEHDPTYELLSKIETDTQVRFVEEKIVATLLSANMITKERAEQFITTIRFTLPELQLIDLNRYNSYGIYEFSPSPRMVPKGLFLADLMKELTNALAHKAQAVCGSCESRPECYQEGASIPNKAGSELFYPSCYCTGCLTSLGCLSANSGIAAIYDQMTGICGVGL